MRVAVSGKTYYAALDPHATDVPREEGWPVPTMARAGKGHRFTYDLTREQAEAMLDHLAVLGESFTMEGSVDDPDTYAEGRACLKDAARLRAALAREEVGA